MASPAVSFEGFGVIDDADDDTSWTGGSADSDSEIQGAACIGAKASNATVAFTYDASADAGQPLNFSSSHRGQHAYVWLNCLTPNLDTISNGGIRIRLGSDATNFGDWYVGGDGSEAGDPYRGGWKNFVIDTQRDFDAVAGTFLASSNPDQLTAVDLYGGVVSTVATIMGNFNNALIDQIAIGSGLRIKDGDETTPGTLSSFVSADEGTIANKYGVVRSISGISLFQGKVIIGHSGTSSATYFSDQSQILVFEDAPVADDFYEVLLQDDDGATTTTAILGEFSGGVTTAGCFLNAAGSRKWTLTSELNNGGSSLEVYASTLQNMRRADLTNNCTFLDCSIIGSGLWEANGAEIFSCSFAGGIDSSQIKIDGESDMENVLYCSFTNCDRAIEITATGSYTFQNLFFAGNTFDVQNSSEGEVTINIVGGSAISVENVGASTTIVVNSITITLTGLVENTEVRVYEEGTTTEIDGVENSGTSFAFSVDASQAVDIRIHNVDYEYEEILNFLPGSSTSLPIQQTFDRNYENP